MKQFVILFVFPIIFLFSCNPNIIDNPIRTGHTEPVPASWNGSYFRETGFKLGENNWVIKNGNIYSVDPSSDEDLIFGVDSLLSDDKRMTCSETECYIIYISTADHVVDLTKNHDTSGDYIDYNMLGGAWGKYRKL
jgi:hypothetical protein